VQAGQLLAHHQGHGGTQAISGLPRVTEVVRGAKAQMAGGIAEISGRSSLKATTQAK